MANSDYKAFIVEGEAREPLIIANISKVFFNHGNFEIITLPAGENIYMLWKKLKDDDFDTDIYDIEIWKDIIDVFAMRVSCLLGIEKTIEYKDYSEQITPYEIQKIEEKIFKMKQVFVLSAFPEFLVDYFGLKLWKTCVKHTTNKLYNQKCQNNFRNNYSGNFIFKQLKNG